MYLSICITIKNRTNVKTDFGVLNLFPKCLESIKNSIPQHAPTELIITDWQSTDCNIYNTIEQAGLDIPIELVTIKSNNQFSVGIGRNIAAKKSIGDILLFIDTDILINENTLMECLRVVNQYGTCWPTIMYQKTPNQEHWEVHEGGGIVFIKRDIFEKSGGWPEFWSYGFEDTQFVERVLKITGQNHICKESFIHQWHPDKIGWPKFEDKELLPIKNKYQQKIDDEISILQSTIKQTLNNPNTTHSKIKIAKG